MNDEDLLGYFKIHSRTERALFHRDHVRRLLELAGEEPNGLGLMSEFIAVHSSLSDPLVKKARARMDVDDARFTLIAGFVSEEDRDAARRMSLSELARRAYNFQAELRHLGLEEAAQ